MSVGITGCAWRLPLGATVDEAVGRLLAGERAARPNARFDMSSYACRLGAAIPQEPAPSRHRRFLRRMGLFGVEVGLEALAQSGVQGGERLGLFAAVGGLRAHWNEMMPALEHQRLDGEGAWARGYRLFHPFWMLHHLSNNAHALLAIDVGAKGEGVTFAGANAGAQALASAIAALESRAIDAALVIAYDSLLEPETLVELAARGAATPDDLDALIAPYDSGARGAVPGEAAAAVVLERTTDAKGRVRALVEARDGADGSRGEPEAEALRSVVEPLAREIGWVDGAALARADRDAMERDVLGASVGADTPLTSLGAATGLLGAATPVVQAIALSELLLRGLVPPIAGTHDLAAGALVPVQSAQPTKARAALGVSLGAPGLVGAVRVEVAS